MGSYSAKLCTSHPCHISKGEVMARFQNGWLRKKHRKSGEVWLFCYRQRRQEDGKWVEATPIRVGSLKEFPSEETAWRRVEELRLNPNQSTFGVSPQATFGQLAAHYMQHELPENQDNARSRKRIRRSSSIGAISNVGPCPAGRGRQHSPSSRSKSSVGSRRSGRNMALKTQL